MRFADLDLNKTYSYAEYYEWKFEERVELIDGKVFKMNNVSNRIHQEVLGHIFVRIGNFIEGTPYEIYAAPFDVRIYSDSKIDEAITTVVQPDLSLICNKSKLDYRGCIGTPDLVVEILKPGDNSVDLREKFEVYRLAGVKEYWVVSPQNQWLRIYTLTKGKYVESPYLLAGDTAVSSVLDGFSLNIAELFKGIEPQE